jgi:hypothetical protein
MKKKSDRNVTYVTIHRWGGTFLGPDARNAYVQEKEKKDEAAG